MKSLEHQINRFIRIQPAYIKKQKFFAGDLPNAGDLLAGKFFWDCLEAVVIAPWIHHFYFFLIGREIVHKLPFDILAGALDSRLVKFTG